MYQIRKCNEKIRKNIVNLFSTGIQIALQRHILTRVCPSPDKPSLQRMKIRYSEGLSGQIFCPLYPISGISISIISRVYCTYYPWNLALTSLKRLHYRNSLNLTFTLLGPQATGLLTSPCCIQLTCNSEEDSLRLRLLVVSYPWSFRTTSWSFHT